MCLAIYLVFGPSLWGTLGLYWRGEIYLVGPYSNATRHISNDELVGGLVRHLKCHILQPPDMGWSATIPKQSFAKGRMDFFLGDRIGIGEGLKDTSMEKNDEKCICPVQELLLYYLLAQNSWVFLNGAKSQAMVGFAPRGFEYSHGKLTPQFKSLAQEVHWFHHRRLGGFGLRLVVSPSMPGRPGLPSGAPGGPWKVRARRCRCRGRVEGASCSKWADLVGNSSGIEVVDRCWVLI